MSRNIYSTNNRRPGARSSGGYSPARQTQKSKGRRKQFIHPSKFIKAARMTVQEEYLPTHTFADFAVNELIKKNITGKGITVPSPIQDQAIPLGLQGKDVLGIANTGTGKTIAFTVPLLQKLLDDKKASALVVAPTRELAQQIIEEMKTIAKGSGLSGVLIIGGSSMGEQLRELKHNPRVIIGTPGRIKDHIKRGTVNLGAVSIVVLDEVDRMLDMGFVDDVTEILSSVPSERQSFFFSATMDTKVRSLIEKFAPQHETVSVKTGDTSDNVEQQVVECRRGENKVDKLHDILNKESVSKVLVFDDTQRGVERLHEQLKDRGFGVEAIHGGKTQGQRTRALNRFKKGEVKLLVATDVAARGIDVSDITHVINFSTPQTYDDYIHRIGRAGRAGRKGYALTFIEQ